MIDRAWETLGRRFTLVRRTAIVALVVVAAAIGNVAWMSRQTWGPYRNYRGVAEFIVAESAARGGAESAARGGAESAARGGAESAARGGADSAASGRPAPIAVTAP